MKAPLTGGYLPALYDILGFLSQAREGDEDKVWSRIVDKCSVAVDVEAATYFTFLPKMRQLIARYSLGISAKQLAGTPIEIGAGICGWVAKHREPLFIADAYKDERFLKHIDEITGFKTRNILAIPLYDQMELAGIIELLNKRTGDFTNDDLRFVEAASRATAITLRSFRLDSMIGKVTSHNASILENLGGGFLAVDLRGRLILCNPAARRILMISPELPMNLPIEQALKHLPELSDILNKTISSRQTVRRQDLSWTYEGQKHVLGYSTIMIQDPQGAVTGVGLSFQDITGVKK